MKKFAIIFLSFIILLSPCAMAARQPLLKGHSRLSLPRILLKASVRHGLAKSCSDPMTMPLMIQDSSVLYDFSKKIYVPGELITVTYSGSGHLASLVQIVADDSIAQNIYGASWKTIYYSNPGGDIDSVIDQTFGDSGWTNHDKLTISPPISDAYLAIDRPQGTGFGLFCQNGALYFHMSSMDGYYWNTDVKTWSRSGRDTVSIVSPGILARTDLQWNEGTNSFESNYCDSFFTQGGNNIVKAIETNFNDSMKYICTGTYDSAGNEIEESQTSMVWDDTSGLWALNSKIKYMQTYDTKGVLASSVLQDSSSDHWTPIDSCIKIMYRYTYDNSGIIVSRIDSTWYSDDNITREIHYFKYQNIASRTPPRPFLAPAFRPSAIVLADGTVTTDSPVSISVFDLCGRSICTVRAHSHMFLWTWCKNNGIAVGKGVYAAKIMETGKSYPVWNAP